MPSKTAHTVQNTSQTTPFLHLSRRFASHRQTNLTHRHLSHTHTHTHTHTRSHERPQGAALFSGSTMAQRGFAPLRVNKFVTKFTV
jgi:hypothetical protein